MQKKILIVLLAIVLLFAFCWVRDFCIKSLIGTVATGVTGAPTSIGGLSLSIIRQSIKITDFKMYNPKGFPKDILVDISKIGVSCDLAALIKGKIHLKQIDLEIKEIGMAKNKEGKLNVDSLKITAAKPEEKKGKPAKQLAMQIDTINLGMGKVVSRDYSVEGPAAVKVYDINLNKTYKDITSAQQLAALIISEPLKAAGIQGLAVYGVSILTGVAALPVAVAFTFAGKDYAQETYSVSWDKVYEAGLSALKEAGKVKKENSKNGVISADVSGAKVALKIKQISQKDTQVTVSARKHMLPQPEIAAGIIYKISEKLK